MGNKVVKPYAGGKDDLGLVDFERGKFICIDIVLR